MIRLRQVLNARGNWRSVFDLVGTMAAIVAVIAVISNGKSGRTVDARLGPSAEQFAALVAELSDNEFSEALEVLVNEATAIAQDRYRIESEATDQATEQFAAEKVVKAYLEPIARAAELMPEGMADQLANVDRASASDSEVASLMEQFSVPSYDRSPVADQFLGSVLKKTICISSSEILPHHNRS